jgi:hypothetical protein
MACKIQERPRLKNKTAPDADQRLCRGPRRQASGIDTRGAGGGGFLPSMPVETAREFDTLQPTAGNRRREQA